MKDGVVPKRDRAIMMVRLRNKTLRSM